MKSESNTVDEAIKTSQGDSRRSACVWIRLKDVEKWKI